MMTGYSSKIAVKDSFDDDDVSDDVEDEVFIRDGRNGFKVDEEIGVKRPLMAPRRKYKSNKMHPDNCKRPFHRRFYFPYCYTLLAISAILGVILVMTMILKTFPIPLDKIRQWRIIGNRRFDVNILPCNDFSVGNVWHQSFFKFTSEAALVLADLNDDGIDDIVLGYATGADEDSETRKCSEYPGSNDICGGGALALDGKSGKFLWQYWTRKDVLLVDCSANINADKTHDCILSGKGGVLCTVDGKTGKLIWEVEKTKELFVIDIYFAQYVSDLDGDGCSDILVAHTSDETGLLIVLSGRNGRTIGQIKTLPREGLYTVPRITITPESTYMVVFATGQPNAVSGGTLYAVPLYSIAMSDDRSTEVWRDKEAGISSGIVLADMNDDGVEDIIITSGSKLSVINGTNYEMLWNVSSDVSSDLDDEISKQILIGPSAAYFDDDTIPDLLINHLIGPSFPSYYYSQTWVAGGKNGESLLDEPMIGGGDITAPGITISFSGLGNDMFLFWITSCNSHVQLQKTPFLLDKGSSTMHERSHTDFCKLRFNKTLETNLYALNQHIKPPGLRIYSSNIYWELEHNNTPPVNDLKQDDNSNLKWPKTVKLNKSKAKQQEEIASYFGYPQENIEDASLNNFAKYGESLNEQPDTPVRNMPSLGINLGELATDYGPIYSQEVVPQEYLNVDLDEDRDERANIRTRSRRHSTKKAHNGSLARATVTATLAKPLSGKGIDIIFSTYWETPSGNVRILTEREQLCIQKKIDSVRQSSGTLNEIEMEVVEGNAQRECLPPLEPAKNDNGQLTMYRVNIACKSCGELSANEQCSQPLPLEMQSYSHRACNVYFKKRYNLVPA